LHRGTPGHMRLPHRLQGQKVQSQGGAGAYCGGDLAAQLVHYDLHLCDMTAMAMHVCTAFTMDIRHMKQT